MKAFDEQFRNTGVDVFAVLPGNGILGCWKRESSKSAMPDTSNFTV